MLNVCMICVDIGRVSVVVLGLSRNVIDNSI